MTSSAFVFSSAKLAAIKAKQLAKAFPFLKLSVAQEATARALGYSTWYECTHRGTVGKPSPSDQAAGLAVRVTRYYQQAGVLVGLGVTPSEADLWVRAWGLTGLATLAPKEAIPMYYRWRDAVELLERGQLSDEDITQEWGEADWSKYPEIDRPQRICTGVILGPCGEYPHYAVDPAVQARIPIYMRGPASLYHYEDDGDLLAMWIPGFPADSARERLCERLNRVQHEWHHGTAHARSTAPVLPKLEAAAMAAPNAMVVISQRAMPDGQDGFHFDRYALACLRGRDFAAFVRAKGAVDPSKVIWYRDIAAPITLNFYDWLEGMELTERVSLPVFTEAQQHHPCLPVYSYPFMTAPMSSDEYCGSIERTCLLPLDQDFGDRDDDGGGDDGLGDPTGPLMEVGIDELQPA